MPDHFGAQFAPALALLSAAEAASTLRVGTLVYDNDFRHPAVLAKEAATLDVLSGGRFELGIGAGWLRSEYELAGIAFEPGRVRVDRLEEAIAALRALFRGTPAHSRAGTCALAGLAGTPAPAQPGAARRSSSAAAGRACCASRAARPTSPASCRAPAPTARASISAISAARRSPTRCAGRARERGRASTRSS